MKQTGKKMQKIPESLKVVVTQILGQLYAKQFVMNLMNSTKTSFCFMLLFNYYDIDQSVMHFLKKSQ